MAEIRSWVWKYIDVFTIILLVSSGVLAIELIYSYVKVGYSIWFFITYIVTLVTTGLYVFAIRTALKDINDGYVEKYGDGVSEKYCDACARATPFKGQICQRCKTVKYD